MSVATSNGQDYRAEPRAVAPGGRQSYKERFCYQQSYGVKISDQLPERSSTSNFKETVPSDFKKIHFFFSLKSREI